MCNLYSLTKGQAAIREIAGAMTDRTDNLPSLPAIFLDRSAPPGTSAATPPPVHRQALRRVRGAIR